VENASSYKGASLHWICIKDILVRCSKRNRKAGHNTLPKRRTFRRAFQARCCKSELTKFSRTSSCRCSASWAAVKSWTC